MEKPKAIVLDVDGVCLDSSAVLKELLKSVPEFKDLYPPKMIP